MAAKRTAPKPTRTPTRTTGATRAASPTRAKPGKPAKAAKPPKAAARTPAKPKGRGGQPLGRVASKRVPSTASRRPAKPVATARSAAARQRALPPTPAPLDAERFPNIAAQRAWDREEHVKRAIELGTPREIARRHAGEDVDDDL